MPLFFLSVLGLFRGELEVDLLRFLPGKNISVHEPLRLESGLEDFSLVISGTVNKEL
jgi:hypothetical protein